MRYRPRRRGITVDLCISTTLDLFRDVYRGLDAEIQGLSPDELTWTPAPETNSIAVLVVHTIGSAEEVIRVVRGMTSDRDREAEFIPNDLSKQALRDRIAAALRFIDETATGITGDDLAATRERPNRNPHPGM
jgi:hypothetical protein